MATYTVQTVTRSGITPTKNAVASSDNFVNDGRTVLHVTNGSGGSLTVTIVTPNTSDGLAVADRTVTIPNGEERVIGPFPRSVYNDSDGNVTVQFSATTSVTCQVLSVTP